MDGKKKDPLDEVFTKSLTIQEIKDLEDRINEYRKLYVNAVLVREKEIVEIMRERQELLSLIIKLNKRIEELKELTQ